MGSQLGERLRDEKTILHWVIKEMMRWCGLYFSGGGWGKSAGCFKQGKKIVFHHWRRTFLKN
jgi:hypothetical protein